MKSTDPLNPSPSVFGILLTSKCNVSCRHCCNNSGPGSDRVLGLDYVKGLIDEAAKISSVREIGLSGGEPFLHLNLVREAIRHARGHGLTASVTTNGFWGKSARARKMLLDLQTDGLISLCISTSQFHQEFIGIETVVAAASVSLSTGLQTTINVVSSPDLHPDTIVAALGDLADKVGIVVMPCLPAGRATVAVEMQEFAALSPHPVGNCRHHFQKLAVDLDGDVWPCCSPGGFTAPLRMGNAKEKPVNEIVAGAVRNSLLAILDAVGPAFFLPFLREAGVTDELPDLFADQCHLCHSMLSSPRTAVVVEDACRRLAQEVHQLPAAKRPAGRIAMLADENQTAPA